MTKVKACLIILCLVSLTGCVGQEAREVVVSRIDCAVESQADVIAQRESYIADGGD